MTKFLDTASDDPAKAARELHAQLKRGYVREIKPEQVRSLAEELLVKWAIGERLAVRLAVERRFGKPNLASKTMLNIFQGVFTRSLEFEASNFSGPRAVEAIEAWIEHNSSTKLSSDCLPTRDQLPPHSVEQLPPDSWFRRVFVCLSAHPEERVFVFGLLAVARHWVDLYKKKRGKGATNDRDLATIVSGVLLNAKLSSQRLEPVLAGAASIEEQNRQIRREETNLIRRLEHHQNRCDKLEQSNSELVANIEDLTQTNDDRNARIGQLEKNLAEAKNRYELLNQHWEGASQTKLEQQSASFSDSVGHELEEARLSLDRDSPNIEMALRRLDRIREIIGSNR